MEKPFDVDDVRKLYEAFIQLCDYVEEENGCGKCPRWNICSNQDKTDVHQFAEALARIREKNRYSRSIKTQGINR